MQEVSEDGEAAPIAFVINSLQGGGAERVLTTLLKQFSLPDKPLGNNQLHLVLLDKTERKYPVPDSIVIHELDTGGSLVQSIGQLRRKLSEIGPRTAMSFLTRSNCANVLAARSLGHRCVISERVNTTSHFGRGVRARVNRSIVRRLYHKADCIVANSVGVRDDLTNNYDVLRQQVEVIDNPFDLDAIHHKAAAESAFTRSTPYVVAVGRLTRNKNFPMLIEAFAKSGIASDLVILGEGEEREKLVGQVEKVGLSGRVHLLGYQDNPYPIVAGAQFYASSSNAEGFPNATAEAMALGRPVITTDCPSGPSELLQGEAPPGKGVTEAECGLLVPVGDAAAMADALCRMSKPALAAHYGARAAVRMKDFRADIVAARYADTITGYPK